MLHPGHNLTIQRLGHGDLRPVERARLLQPGDTGTPLRAGDAALAVVDSAWVDAGNQVMAWAVNSGGTIQGACTYHIDSVGTPDAYSQMTFQGSVTAHVVAVLSNGTTEEADVTIAGMDITPLY